MKNSWEPQNQWWDSTQVFCHRNIPDPLHADDVDDEPLDSDDDGGDVVGAERSGAGSDDDGAAYRAAAPPPVVVAAAGGGNDRAPSGYGEHW